MGKSGDARETLPTGMSSGLARALMEVDISGAGEPGSGEKLAHPAPVSVVNSYSVNSYKPVAEPNSLQTLQPAQISKSTEDVAEVTASK